MLITRLITDAEDILSRIEAIKSQLDLEGIPITASAEPFSGGAVLQIESFSGSRRVMRPVLDEVFPDADILIADEQIETPALFVSDMDSTMIEQECIDELADYAGLKDKVANITERAMQGELDFTQALEERVGLLAGLEEAVIEQCLSDRICLMPGARTLVQTLKAKGTRCVLVTGGFHHFADRIAEQIGFDRVVGNRLHVADGKLSGKLEGPITDSKTKRAVLVEEHGRLPAGSRSLASGDGANDIPMLEVADYGIAYHAKAKAREAANGQVNQGDLSNILRLLGIAEGEWVRD